MSRPQRPEYGQTPAGSSLDRYDSTSSELSWRARQELQHIDNVAAVERAGIERREDLRATVAERRITNGMELHREGVRALARIESDISEQLPRGSEAEFLARRMQEEFAYAATRIMVRYMEGR